MACTASNAHAGAPGRVRRHTRRAQHHSANATAVIHSACANRACDGNRACDVCPAIGDATGTTDRAHSGGGDCASRRARRQPWRDGALD